MGSGRPPLPTDPDEPTVAHVLTADLELEEDEGGDSKLYVAPHGPVAHSPPPAAEPKTRVLLNVGSAPPQSTSSRRAATTVVGHSRAAMNDEETIVVPRSSLRPTGTQGRLLVIAACIVGAAFLALAYFKSG